MSISPYVRDLRAHVGSARILLPSVSAHIFDESGRLLLIRQRDGDVWSTPGGSIEIDEKPADAVVREAWEETGLLVTPLRLAAVFGGPEFVVYYPNGDETQYVIIAFECRVIGGDLRAETDETSAARYFTREEASELEVASWLQHILDDVYARDNAFEPPGWSPDPGS